MPTGKVKWFNGAKGFGFLVAEDGGDVFVHQSAVQGSDYGPLSDGQPVEFEMGPGPKGPQAVAVRSMGPPPRFMRRPPEDRPFSSPHRDSKDSRAGGRQRRDR